jgi:hypothetical protein
MLSCGVDGCMRRTRQIPRVERRGFWVVVLLLCAIALLVSIRRLVALAEPPSGGSSELAVLNAVFAAKPGLTRSHVIAGIVLALAIPLQLSARIRQRFPGFHRWLGRFLMVVGVAVGISGYAMVAAPVSGWVEVAAIMVFGTAFLGSLLTAWWHIRNGDVARHREWMLRALGIMLGIATTRPVMGMFFATRRFTGLSPQQFFGMAFWIGFTSTALAAEWYVRHTRSTGREEPAADHTHASVIGR